MFALDSIRMQVRCRGVHFIIIYKGWIWENLHAVVLVCCTELINNRFISSKLSERNQYILH